MKSGKKEEEITTSGAARLSLSHLIDLSRKEGKLPWKKREKKTVSPKGAE